MIKELVFATGNPNKVREITQILGNTLTIKSLKDIGCFEDIPETSPTIQGNAILKANYVVEHFQLDCFAEDTGLEIEALNGAPGVISARYAGPEKNADANMNKVLAELAEKTNRKARFKTVIALAMKGKMHTFEGIINGVISTEKQGDGGFGYDPIFIPDGYQVSFAEMSIEAKNKISHRSVAVHKFISFLRPILGI